MKRDLSDADLEAKIVLSEIAIFHTQTNTKLIKTCSKLYRCLERIEQLSDNAANINRIQSIARIGIEHLDNL